MSDPSDKARRTVKRFDTPEQEAYLGIVRTYSILITPFERLFKHHGLSQGTYNALRILRGAGESGRMCHEIGKHLVAQVPDVTRLIDRLEEMGLRIGVTLRMVQPGSPCIVAVGNHRFSLRIDDSAVVLVALES